MDSSSLFHLLIDILFVLTPSFPLTYITLCHECHSVVYDLFLFLTTYIMYKHFCFLLEKVVNRVEYNRLLFPQLWGPSLHSSESCFSNITIELMVDKTIKSMDKQGHPH